MVVLPQHLVRDIILSVLLYYHINVHRAMVSAVEVVRVGIYVPVALYHYGLYELGTDNISFVNSLYINDGVMKQFP